MEATEQIENENVKIESRRLSKDIMLTNNDELTITNAIPDVDSTTNKTKIADNVIPVVLSNDNNNDLNNKTVSVTTPTTPTTPNNSNKTNHLINNNNNNNNKNLNTSTITINNTDLVLSDPSNSLASNISQVTVVTSHPPVIIDNNASVKISGRALSPLQPITPKQSQSASADEVVIVSNETNKTHINESSTDDDYQSLDSLENSPKYAAVNKSQSQGNI